MEDENTCSTIKNHYKHKIEKSPLKKGFYKAKCMNLLENIKSSKKSEISSKTKNNLLLAIKNLKRKLYYMTNKCESMYNIDIKCKELKKEITTLQTEYQVLTEKLKSAKLTNESLTNEISSLKKRENEIKEKFG